MMGNKKPKLDLKNVVVNVEGCSKEELEKIQDVFFENGYGWGGKKIYNKLIDPKAILYIYSKELDLGWGTTEDFLSGYKETHREITIEELLGKKKPKKPKPAPKYFKFVTVNEKRETVFLNDLILLKRIATNSMKGKVVIYKLTPLLEVFDKRGVRKIKETK